MMLVFSQRDDDQERHDDYDEELPDAPPNYWMWVSILAIFLMLLITGELTR